MPIYLVYIVLFVFVLADITYLLCSNFRRRKKEKNSIDNLRERNGILYLQYDLQSKNILVNGRLYSNVAICRNLLKGCKQKEFLNGLEKLLSKEIDKFSITKKDKEMIYDFCFFIIKKTSKQLELKCEYNVGKYLPSLKMDNLEDLKKIHNKQTSKHAVLYCIDVRDFNSINQRFGQKCGDYLLETIKNRLAKEDKYKTAYLGDDEFAIYYNKKISKKKAMSIIKKINKQLIKPVDVGSVNIEMSFAIGMCVGEYDNFDELVRCAYIATDYARKRTKYNIVIYNDEMKIEEEIMKICTNEINSIIKNKTIAVTYNPVYFHGKAKYIGHISSPVFSSANVDIDMLKKVSDQINKREQFMYTVFDQQLVNFIKNRQSKSSKAFINLHLDDLSSFLEVYFSNPSYGDCKIVLCLNVKKGYEMINKFPSIGSNISKVLDEGIEIAVNINCNNIYDYDYILSNSNYLILDEGLVSSSITSRGKLVNIVEQAKNYNLEMLATGIKDYVEFENLLKYDVSFFTGPYFGKSTPKPTEPEFSKTRIFNKFANIAKKNKKKKKK